jgi:hypothetical protein
MCLLVRKLSSNVNECQPLAAGISGVRLAGGNYYKMGVGVGGGEGGAWGGGGGPGVGVLQARKESNGLSRSVGGVGGGGSGAGIWGNGGAELRRSVGGGSSGGGVVGGGDRMPFVSAAEHASRVRRDAVIAQRRPASPPLEERPKPRAFFWKSAAPGVGSGGQSAYRARAQTAPHGASRTRGTPARELRQELSIGSGGGGGAWGGSSSGGGSGGVGIAGGRAWQSLLITASTRSFGPRSFVTWHPMNWQAIYARP